LLRVARNKLRTTRNLLRATSIMLRAASCLLRATSCAGVNAALDESQSATEFNAASPVQSISQIG